MKLVVVMVQDYDAPEILRLMIDRGFRVTQVSSTGGFLRSGNVVFLVGVDDSDVQRLTRIIDDVCSERVEVIRPSGVAEFEEWYPPDQIEVEVGGALLLVFHVDRFERV